MPNLRIHIDDGLWAQHEAEVSAVLPELRSLLCAELGVTPAHCHLGVIPLRALPDQPAVSIELQILALPDRTRDKVEAVAAALRTAFTARVGLSAAVRIALMDRASYVTLK